MEIILIFIDSIQPFLESESRVCAWYQGIINVTQDRVKTVLFYLFFTWCGVIYRWVSSSFEEVINCLQTEEVYHHHQIVYLYKAENDNIIVFIC